MYLIANITNAFRFTRAFINFLRDERKRGTLRANFRSLARTTADALEAARIFRPFEGS
ncbi:MAG TPA: hypothetical protein PKN50_07890 [Spirochaetota bacterium]|jgi:hypothetical protein|nr:hypothetical protein [Spirochaetota bacterium]HPV42818.1 hypothetical protein [Spirochaetota bacterium]